MPAAVITVFAGVYQRWKQLTTEARVKRRTVARVPRIGAPSGWPRQKLWVSISCASDSGLSSSMRISSRMTCFSLPMSSSAKSGTQNQVGEHVEGDGQVFVQHLGIEADHLFGGEGVEQAADGIHLAGNLLGACAARCP